MASKYNLARISKIADILVGAILEPGERAPVYITREMVKSMRPGSLIIDLAIDQGGCIETSRLTTLEHPCFVEEGVMHYCVPNITASVSRTSSKVLSNMVSPFLVGVGEKGIRKSLKTNPILACGVYVHKGHLVKKHIAERFGLPYKSLSTAL
jgi:alanine dehydrogenase